MPTRHHSNQRCFMVDSASRDNRSAHAHIKGVNPRAQFYAAFEFFERCIGRQQNAADDFRIVAGWAHRHRHIFALIKARAIECSIAIAGIGTGAILALSLLG